MYRENAWKKYDASMEKEVMSFAEGYKEFLSNSKTERLAVKEATKRLKEAGFKDVNEVKKVSPGDKVYFVNRNKNVCAFVIGKKIITEGLRILGAHIDSPRMDLTSAKAVVVLPTPAGPVNIKLGMLFSPTYFSSLATICFCPTMSSNFCGLYFSTHGPLI